MLTMRQEMTLADKVQQGVCGSCHKKDETVATQYSYGVYAGVLCESCARGNYRDQCGLRPEGQGTRTEYEEMAGPGTYDEDE